MFKINPGQKENFVQKKKFALRRELMYITKILTSTSCISNPKVDAFWRNKKKWWCYLLEVHPRLPGQVEDAVW